ncbi:carbohydrate-binding protein [Aquimarina latercula]|uniref:carbohydrate-binding protein n=1 Tax=Aquimarina latercula TaxID=987 RepID=UPI000415FEAE|nr:carbohydrate-binding protein [Aquimarina latercula]
MKNLVSKKYKYSTQKTIGSMLFLLIFITTQLEAQLRVGDPGVTFDSEKFDNRYQQMKEWEKAGVRGGIPFLKDIKIVKTLTNGADSDAINRAIEDASKQNGLVAVFLKNGTYNINKRVSMKSNVSLIGESREGVKCIIRMNSSNAFSFYKVSKSGIYTLTIEGSWGKPKYDWNYSLSANDELRGNDNISVKFNDSPDCWLDKVNIINSARDPVRVPSNHVTLRDLMVDGAHKKAGGAQGYFFIQGAYNLITGCKVTRLRHISLQGSNVEYNVVYDNDFRQEVSFHSGDNGNNLIENNRITLPRDMPNSKADTPNAAYNNRNEPNYYAIMGPWSIQHQNSKKPNFIYKNNCLEENHNNIKPWSDPNLLYKGPREVKPSNPATNFPALSASESPKGGTLYPVLLGSGGTNIKPEVSVTSPSNGTNFEEGQSVTIKANASDSDGTVSKVEFFVNGSLVGTDTTSPYNITTTLNNVGNYTITAKAIDNDEAVSTSVPITITVEDDSVPPGDIINIPGSFEAEDLITKSGSVRIEDTPGTTSGKNLGFIKNGDFVDYTVNIDISSEYTFDIYASSNGAGGKVDILESGFIVGTINIPVTGQWHNYKKYSTTVSLTSGEKTLRLSFKGGSGYLYNIDKVIATKIQQVEQTVTLIPIQDAYLQGSTRHNLDMIRIEHNRRSGYLMFDLSSINGTITKADLKFTVYSDAGNGNIAVSKGNSNNWTETNLSNSNKPGKGAQLGSLNTNLPIGSTKTIPLKTTQISGNKISFVIDALSGNDFAFASKENISVSKPQLIITYTTNRSDENTSKDVLLYPNPVINTINFSSNIEGQIVKVFNVNGVLMKETVLEAGQNSIDVANLSSGYYIINVLEAGKSNKLIVSKKIVKQ